MSPIRHAVFLAIVPLVSTALLMANDTEIGLSLGAGTPGAKNLNLANGTLISGTGTAITTQFSGPWKLVGLDLAYEMKRTEKMKVWARAGFTTALGTPDYAKDGQDSPVAFTYHSESINGSLKYSSFTGGGGVSFITNKLGEYGLSLDYRTHRTRLTGTRTQVDIPGTLGNSGYSLTSTDSDLLVTLSMTFVQVHRTYKTFQRISYGFAFGGSDGDVNADHQGWVMSKAYLWRIQPGQELRFGYGVRL